MTLRRAFFEASIILAAHLPVSGEVKEAFMIVETESGALQISPSFSVADGKITMVAQLRGIQNVHPLCAVIRAGAHENFFCDDGDLRMLNPSQAEQMIDGLRTEKETLQEAKRALFAKEHEIRKLKATIGSLVSIENLVTLRDERMKLEESIESLRQEKQTLSAAVRDYRDAKPTQDTALIERSLRVALQEIERFKRSQIQK